MFGDGWEGEYDERGARRRKRARGAQGAQGRRGGQHRRQRRRRTSPRSRRRSAVAEFKGRDLGEGRARKPGGFERTCDRTGKEARRPATLDSPSPTATRRAAGGGLKVARGDLRKVAASACRLRVVRGTSGA